MNLKFLCLTAIAVLALTDAVTADSLGGPNAWGIVPPYNPLHHDAGNQQPEGQHRSLCEDASRPADERIAACRKLIDTKSRSSNTWRALGRAYLDRDDVAAAIDAFTHSIVDDKSWLAQTDRAIAYARSGDYDRAMVDANDYAKINSGNAESLAVRCRVHAIVDKDREAGLADCDAALAKEPHLADALNDRALLLFRLGRTSDALAASNDALNFGGNDPLTLYLRGTIEKQNGDVAGDADMAAARARAPTVAEQLTHYKPGHTKRVAADVEPPP